MDQQINQDKNVVVQADVPPEDQQIDQDKNVVVIVDVPPEDNKNENQKIGTCCGEFMHFMTVFCCCKKMDSRSFSFHLKYCNCHRNTLFCILGLLWLGVMLTIVIVVTVPH
ncbi:hypothetical protein Klosneuvirus_1_397 [Klosneuvirus KNV1]|uniref:Transmembrane protein n=1 Tax=Klosneuvirus KNV1 TaxID=1977640 RepID=A0A1V0SIJ2_9VIRU|nr:hypothetical protein Klosneuvirus_1_397 [Klosneuvirus KNV1]